MRSSRWTAVVATFFAMAVAISMASAQPAPRGRADLHARTPTRTPTPSSTPSPTPPPEARIGIYANAAGTDCDLNTNLFNPYNVFILVKGVPGLTAADFKISNLGTALEVVPSRTPHPEATVTGNPSTTGAHVTFANCKDVLPLQIFRLTYVPAGDAVTRSEHRCLQRRDLPLHRPVRRHDRVLRDARNPHAQRDPGLRRSDHADADANSYAHEDADHRPEPDLHAHVHAVVDADVPGRLPRR